MGAAAVVFAACAAWLIAYVDQNVSANPTGVPLVVAPEGDVVLFQAIIFKTIADTGHWGVTPFLGAPSGTDLMDFPVFDALLILYCKIARVFTRSWVSIYNFGFVMTYALSAGFAAAAALSVGVRRLEAIALGLLFSFSCYHHHRITGHPNLGWFLCVVPGGVAVAFQLMRREPMGFVAQGKWRVGIRDWRVAVPFAILALFAGLSGTGYYAYFTLWLMTFATLFAFAREPSVAVIVRGIAAGACTVFGVVVAAATALLHAHEAGMPVVHRAPMDTEIFALKLTHLLLPMPGHRIRMFAELRNVYEAANPLRTEASVAALGLLGSIAFVWTVVVVLGRPQAVSTSSSSDTRDLGLLNLCLFLLGTMGGIASFVALAGLTVFRAMNRVSVFIHFASLLAIGLAVSRSELLARLERAKPRAALLARSGLLAVVVAASTWETTYEGPTDEGRASFGETYLARQRFFAKVEERLHGATVLQLPVASFPEGPKVEKLDPYAQLEPYLHTETMRYSAFTIRGREEDARLHALAEGSPREIIAAARSRGFSALFLHRAGYADGGERISTELRALLGPPLFELGEAHLEIFELVPR